MGRVTRWKQCIFYGAMFQFDETTIVPIDTIGDYEIITGFTKSFSRGMTFQDTQEFVIEKPGKYKVDWSLSFTSINNETFDGAIMVNEIEDLSTAAFRKIAANDDGNFGATGIVDLSVNDLVQLGITNMDSTSNPVIDAANMTITFLEKS